MTEDFSTGWDVLDTALRALFTVTSGVTGQDWDEPTPCAQWNATQVLQLAGACALDAGVHTWDLAVATGQLSPLTPAFAADLHAAARQIVAPLRGFAYEPALPPEPGDDDAAALLRYLGRRPDWKAAG